jgi:hypothetical protein
MCRPCVSVHHNVILESWLGCSVAPLLSWKSNAADMVFAA